MKKILLLFICIIPWVLQAQIKTIGPPGAAVYSTSEQITAKILEIKTLNGQVNVLTGQLNDFKKQQSVFQQQINLLNNKKAYLTVTESAQLDKTMLALKQVNGNIATTQVNITETIRKRDTAQNELAKLQQQQRETAVNLAQLQIFLKKNPSLYAEMTEKEVKALDYYLALYKTDKSFRNITDLEANRIEILIAVIDDNIEQAKGKYEAAKEQFKLAIRIIAEHYERELQVVNKISG